MSKERENAKGLILEAAMKVFAEKGFDGARVDEVAKEAGVPKSLIYYHYKGKDQLLEELFKKFIQDYENVMKASTEAEGKYLRFLGTQSDLLRILLIESLKKQTSNLQMFQVVEKQMEFMKTVQHTSFHSAEEEQKRMMAEFFTMMLPYAMFTVFQEEWSEYFGISKDTAAVYFNEILKKTHQLCHEQES